MTDIAVRPAEEIVEYLNSVIAEHLEEGESVLWLVPGGSASVIAIDVMRRLESVDTSRLYITLTDERYGEPGHPNENWTQLTNAGFIPTQAATYRVLTGEAMTCTTAHFDTKLQEWMAQVDFAIGLFGIGVDGHTAGIKPHSPAVTSTDRAACFEGEDFERITITPIGIKDLDEVVVYATGTAKFPVIAQLLEQTIPVDEQPAQALKQVKTVTIFSDYTA